SGNSLANSTASSANSDTPANPRRHPLPENLLIGPQTKQLLLHSDGITGFIAVRFQPWGFSAFSTQKATDLVDHLLPAAKALPPAITTLAGQLQNQSREKKLQLLTTWFINHLPPTSPELKKTHLISVALQTQHGRQKIADLTREFDINSRTLEWYFLQYLGLPAKLFARILRFNHARNLIQQNPDIGLAALAYETGYTDQAHFSKNFRAFFDLSPAQFKARIKKFKSDTAGLDPNVVFVQD
ncbi:helix-turn-helix domain-containing protein, partial [Puia sp.]|uniref:AraC family transcriptional regulator n=1 Tax=Puia sp. TaxID=2045100 RepID=UPI002F3FEDA3